MNPTIATLILLSLPFAAVLLGTAIGCEVASFRKFLRERQS